MIDEVKLVIVILLAGLFAWVFIEALLYFLEKILDFVDRWK